MEIEAIKGNTDLEDKLQHLSLLLQHATTVDDLTDDDIRDIRDFAVLDLLSSSQLKIFVLLASQSLLPNLIGDQPHVSN